MIDITLKELRGEIDRLDESIAALLEERISVARRIGEAKRGKRPVLDSERESAIIERLRQRHPEIDGAALESIWREIMALCRSVE